MLSVSLVGTPLTVASDDRPRRAMLGAATGACRLRIKHQIKRRLAEAAKRTLWLAQPHLARLSLRASRRRIILNINSYNENGSINLRYLNEAALLLSAEMATHSNACSWRLLYFLAAAYVLAMVARRMPSWSLRLRTRGATAMRRARLKLRCVTRERLLRDKHRHYRGSLAKPRRRRNAARKTANMGAVT